MEQTTTRPTFEEWLKGLIEFTAEAAGLEVEQIAINEEEARQHHAEGLTYSTIFFYVWEQDAGNYFKI